MGERGLSGPKIQNLGKLFGAHLTCNEGTYWISPCKPPTEAQSLRVALDQHIIVSISKVSKSLRDERSNFVSIEVPLSFFF